MNTAVAEFCNADNYCTTQSYTVNVTNNTKPSLKSSNKTGLAGFAVFQVIFAVITGMYCWKKHRANRHNISHHVSVAPEQSFLNITNNLVENNTNPLDPNIKNANQVQSLNLADEPSVGSNTTSGPILGNRAQEQDGVNGIWPIYKDQCRNPPNAVPEALAEAVSEAETVSEGDAVPEAGANPETEVPAHHNIPLAFAIFP